MVESLNGGWAEVATSLTGRSEESIREPHRLEETPEDETPEDYSEAIAKQGHRENDNWYLGKISQELTDIMKEENEFWMLQYQNGEEESGFVPVIKVDGEEWLVDEDHHFNTHFMEYDTGEEVWNITVTALAENSDCAGFLLGKYEDEVTGQPVSLERNPVAGIEKEHEEFIDEKDREYMNGRYVAPGFESFYEDRMKDDIERQDLI